MTPYRFINGKTATLDILSPQQKTFVTKIQRVAEENIRSLTRWKLRQWCGEFMKTLSPEIRTLAPDEQSLDSESDAAFPDNDSGDSLEEYEEAESTDEALLRAIFPPAREIIKDPADELVRRMIDDIHERVGIVAGIISHEGDADDSLKPKEWTGAPELPFYLFHLGRDPKTRSIVPVFAKVEVIDTRDGGYRDGLIQEHAKAGRTFLGGFTACDPGDTPKIDALRERYGEEIDALFIRSFSDGFYDTYVGGFGDEQSFEAHIQGRIRVVASRLQSLPGITDDEVNTLKGLFIDACKTGRFWGGQESVLDTPDDAEVPSVAHLLEEILRTLENNRQLWTSGAAVGCIRLTGYLEADLQLLLRACKQDGDPVWQSLVRVVENFIDLSFIKAQDWAVLHRDLQLATL